MRRLGIHLSMLTATSRCHCEHRCSSTARTYNIAQYNWDGHFGAAITLADWDNDGWPDLTFGGTSGAIRTWRNLGAWDSK